MPIEGKFYTFEELQSLLSMTEIELKSYVDQWRWEQPFPDLFYAEDVEETIFNRVSSHPDVLLYCFQSGIKSKERQILF